LTTPAAPLTTTHRRLAEPFQIRRTKEAGFIRADLNVSHDQMKDLARRDAYTISIPTQRHIHREFRIFPELQDKVARRYWSVMTVKNDAPDLITCDRPAPTRLGDKTIVFTISPRHALLGASELYAPAEFEIDASAVAEINTQLVEQAIKQIYSRPAKLHRCGTTSSLPVTFARYFPVSPASRAKADYVDCVGLARTSSGTPGNAYPATLAERNRPGYRRAHDFLSCSLFSQSSAKGTPRTAALIIPIARVVTST